MKKILIIPFLLLSLTAFSQTYLDGTTGVKFKPNGFSYIKSYTSEYQFGNHSRYPMIFQTISTGSFEFMNHTGDSLMRIDGNSTIEFFKPVVFQNNKLTLGELKSDLLTFTSDQMLIRKYDTEYEFGSHSQYQFVFQTLSNGSFEFVNHSGNRLMTINGNSATEFQKGIVTKETISGRDAASIEKFKINTYGDSYFNGGCVGIGTATPAYKLEVEGEVNANAFISKTGNTSHNYFARNGDDAAVFINQESSNSNHPILKLSSGSNVMGTNVKFLVANNGSVGIGTTTIASGDMLTVEGNIKVTGTINGVDVTNLSATSVWNQDQSDNELNYSAGNIVVGTSSQSRNLYVHGMINSTRVKVDPTIAVPDYVFANDYELPTLSSTEKYIKANHHLPEIPSAKEMEKEGIDLGVMNLKLLKKIEELTLHMIDLKKENETLKGELKSKDKDIDSILERLSKLEEK